MHATDQQALFGGYPSVDLHPGNREIPLQERDTMRR
jgi:hypothetical protein